MFLNYNGDQRVPNIFTKNTAAVHEEPSEVSCDLHNGDDDTEVIALIDDLDYGVDSDSLSSSQQSNYSLSSAGSDDSNQPSSNGLLLRHSDDGLSFAHPTSFEEVMTFSTRSVDSLTTSSRLHRHPRKRRSAPNYYRLNPQPRRIGVTPRTSTLSADARSSSSMWKRKRAGWMLRISRSLSSIIGLQGICMHVYGFDGTDCPSLIVYGEPSSNAHFQQLSRVLYEVSLKSGSLGEIYTFMKRNFHKNFMHQLDNENMTSSV